MTKRKAAEGPGDRDLRAQVLAASIALITEEGLGALSMREVARRAGVSHQAPYHHFPDRGAILAAIAAEGFGLLSAGLEAAITGKHGARARLSEGGRAYLQFALEHPAHFRIMFRPELVDLEQHALCKELGDRAFAALEALVGDAVAEGVLTPADAPGLVLVAWSFVHGLASLALDGPLARTQPEEAQAAQLESAFTAFARLLTPPPPKGRRS